AQSVPHRSSLYGARSPPRQSPRPGFGGAAALETRAAEHTSGSTAHERNRFSNVTFQRRFLMAILRYEPWALVSRFHQQLDKALNQDADSFGSNVSWIPQVDVREEAERFVVTADLPGVDGKDIEVT